MSERDLARFWAKVSKGAADECWEWQGFARRGYGLFYMPPNRRYPAHRLAFALSGKDIPQHLVVDHLCRNKACCNPAHLEAVTVGENTRRGESGRNMVILTHCKEGHEFTPENTYVYERPNDTLRQCRTCALERSRRNRARKAARDV